MNRLPDKPSELIRLALGDLKKIESKPNYSVDMDVWVEPGRDDICRVCLAGAVLVERYDIHNVHTVEDDDTNNKLDALNWFRMGDAIMGLVEMGIEASEDNYAELSVLGVAYYEDDQKAFYHDMERMASKLESMEL